MRCPVCGDTLRDQVTHCSTCPMHSGCDMLCCENCGYETVAPHSATVDFFRRLWRVATRARHPADAARPSRG
jgi:hypothetical protein